MVWGMELIFIITAAAIIGYFIGRERRERAAEYREVQEYRVRMGEDQ